MKAEFGQLLNDPFGKQSELLPCHPWQQRQHQPCACRDKSLPQPAQTMQLNAIYETRVLCQGSKILNPAISLSFEVLIRN
jgi:hypothetical protein